MLRYQNVVTPETLEEATQLIQKRSSRIAGGMTWLNLSHGQANNLIDLSLLGLDQIEETKEEYSIGAMVTLHQLEVHPSFFAHTQGVYTKAMQHIVGVQFRNMATIGGSIWGRFGFSDVLAIFYALDAEVELARGGRMPMAEFVTRKRDQDILLRVYVRKSPVTVSYQAVRAQESDLPILNCVSAWDGHKACVVIGARPGAAKKVEDARGFFEQGLTEEAIAGFAEFAASTVPTSSNLRASAAYRSHLVRVLTTRCLEEMKGRMA